MKLISWNVNGIRAAVSHGLADFLVEYRPDILCLQETKISEEALVSRTFDLPGYQEYWHCAARSGYSGTAILVRDGLAGVLGVRSGLGKEIFDREGRVQTVELTDAYLLNVYFPNSNPTLGRLRYKLDFNDALMRYVRRLEKKKPVIITGDFNVAREAIDLARPKENEGKAGFTPEERAWLDKFLSAGFIDSFREKNGQKVQYSWWSFRMNARARNVGWRIDYFCLSAKLKKTLEKAYILDKVTGSDHAPIGLEINLGK